MERRDKLLASPSPFSTLPFNHRKDWFTTTVTSVLSDIYKFFSLQFYLTWIDTADLTRFKKLEPFNELQLMWLHFWGHAVLSNVFPSEIMLLRFIITLFFPWKFRAQLVGKLRVVCADISLLALDWIIFKIDGFK